MKGSRSGSRPGLKVSKTRSDNFRSRPPFLNVCSIFHSNDFFVISMVHCYGHTANGEANICFLLSDSLATNYCFALSLVTRKQKESDEISSLLNNGKLSICVIICWIAQLHLFRKSLKPLVDESETGHFIVLRVVGESETSQKKVGNLLTLRNTHNTAHNCLTVLYVRR